MISPYTTFDNSSSLGLQMDKLSSMNRNPNY